MNKSHFMSHGKFTNVTLPVSVEHLKHSDPNRILSFWAGRDQGKQELRFVGSSHPYQSLKGKIGKPDTTGLVFVDNAGPFQLGPFDPWKLREVFLAWPPDEWPNFVVMADPFGLETVNQRLFENWQKLIRDALIQPAQEWKMLESKSGIKSGQFRLSGPLSITFEWESEAPRAVIRESTALGAIIATIQIDKLAGAEFKVCARPDCKNPPFKVEARHKIFCSADCGHLVAVRNSRKRAREGAGRKRK